jgi:hypothetical protein
VQHCQLLIYYVDKEETEHDETLELDNDGYPRLPDNVMDLRLSRKKAVIRRFMGAVRRMEISMSD